MAIDQAYWGNVVLKILSDKITLIAKIAFISEPSSASFVNLWMRKFLFFHWHWEYWTLLKRAGEAKVKARLFFFEPGLLFDDMVLFLFLLLVVVVV